MEDPHAIQSHYGRNNIGHKIGYTYFLTALSRVNREFCKEHYKKITEEEKNMDHRELQPDWNPFKASVNVGIKNEFENNMARKSLHDFVYDIDNTRNADVHFDQKTIRRNNRFRYNNGIPIWQTSMNTRNYERNSDGLHTTQERASLENQIHGYDMSDVFKYATSSQLNRKDKW